MEDNKVKCENCKHAIMFMKVRDAVTCTVNPQRPQVYFNNEWEHCPRYEENNGKK